MFSFLRSLFRKRFTLPPAPDGLPTVTQDEAARLWSVGNGLPRLDWALANDWIAVRTGDSSAAAWHRAVMSACLDEVQDNLPKPHVRWRSLNVEGLAPTTNGLSGTLARVSEMAFSELRSALRPIRGDAPIQPIAIAAIHSYESYIDFTSNYYAEATNSATSGGVYLRDDHPCMPLIVVGTENPHSASCCVVHELTHHALAECSLPLWVEEGFTQMMEERVVGGTNFHLDAEMLGRHRACWRTTDVDEFLSGAAFRSPHGNVQELAYHLAQFIVRAELSTRPTSFFEFARACATLDPDEACVSNLGCSARALVLEKLGMHDPQE